MAYRPGAMNVRPKPISIAPNVAVRISPATWKCRNAGARNITIPSSTAIAPWVGRLTCLRR